MSSQGSDSEYQNGYESEHSSGSEHSAEALRIAELERKVQEQSVMMATMLAMMQKQMDMADAVAKASSPAKPVEKVTTTSSKTTTKAVSKSTSKKVVAEVDEVREKLITKFYDLGFNKRSVNAGLMTNSRIEEYIQSMEDGTFTEYDLLTNEGLYKLCIAQGLKAKPNMSKSVLIKLLSQEDEEEENEDNDWDIDTSFLEKKTLVELKEYCKTNKIKGYSTKKKAELIELIIKQCS